MDRSRSRLSLALPAHTIPTRERRSPLASGEAANLGMSEGEPSLPPFPKNREAHQRCVEVETRCDFPHVNAFRHPRRPVSSRWSEACTSSTTRPPRSAADAAAAELQRISLPLLCVRQDSASFERFALPFWLTEAPMAWGVLWKAHSSLVLEPSLLEPAMQKQLFAP